MTIICIWHLEFWASHCSGRHTRHSHHTADSIIPKFTDEDLILRLKTFDYILQKLNFGYTGEN